MTTRETYTSAGTIAWVTFALAGLTMLASDIVQLLFRYDPGALVEAASTACLVVGILNMCLWYSAARRLRSGGPLSLPKHHKTIVFTLLFFPLFINVLPSIMMHCSLLVGSYIIWWLYKANHTPQV